MNSNPREAIELVQALKSFFLSRKTVIALLLLTFTALIAGGLVPQKIATSATDLDTWRNAHPFLSPWADRLGLFHVFSTPWFAMVLFVACVSLAISFLDQFKAAFRKTFDPLSSPGRDPVTLNVSDELLRRILRREGYLPMGRNGGLRFVRQPWGYWSNVLLHSGMLLIIAASLFVALTQQRGAVALVEGEVHDTHAPWTEDERGKLASPFVLPKAVRLDRLRITFPGNNAAQQAASDVSFISEKGGADPRSVAVNSILHYQGLRIYQSTNYGDAFTVEFADNSGTVHSERLLIPHPPEPDQAGYNDFRLPWLSYELSTKYYADADKKTMKSTDPLLVMRLLDGNREHARISLRIGESGTLGNLSVRLVKAEKWTSLIFVNISGMPVIFFGFLIVVLGTVLNYMSAPREFIALKLADGYSVSWRATRFADFYADEFGRILEKMNKESSR